MKLLSATLLASALTQTALAQVNSLTVTLRFACSQLVVDRVDPIVNPGELYTPHLHQIIGGNSFNVTMDPAAHDLVKLSTCTSCSYKEDFSNYWTSILFFRAKNGSYMRVPQVANQGLVNKGGMGVYYVQNGKVQAFKKGFRMVAGSAGNADSKSVDVRNICHRCWTSTNENTFIGSTVPCSGDQVDIPQDYKCKRIRQNIVFPACWDGVTLDTPDHKSHVAYGTGRNMDCPASHPVRLPQLMYEIMWDLSPFQDKSIWPTDGKDALVYSMNLGGSAAHGDYVFGWQDDTLQKAMDNKCNLNQDCPKAGIHYQQPNVYNKCTVKQSAVEKVDGWISGLPMGKANSAP